MNTRVIIFSEKDFPFIDTFKIEMKDILEALPPMQSVKSAGADDLNRLLKRDSADLLINPYGSAFPEQAWPVIRQFLADGGNLLNLGGCPFSVPVTRKGQNWEAGEKQYNYQHELGITACTPIEMSGIKRYTTLPEEPLLSGLIEEFSCERSYSLQFDLAEGDITSGKSPIRHGIVRPLLFGMADDTSNPVRFAAPVAAVDHYTGQFAGGRWVFANFTSPERPRREILQRLGGFAARGISQFHIRPSFACYYPEERAALIIHANRFSGQGEEPSALSLFLTLKKDKITVCTENIDISEFASPFYKTIPMGTPLSPGFYTVEARLSTGDPDLTDKFSDHFFTGFWCYNDTLASTTQSPRAGADTMMRGDKPSLLIGCAYLDANSGDRMLFEPNPAVWERDFAEMRDADVNVVHTGIWADARRAMFHPGCPSEETMRASIALMLTAAQHDLPVLFSLFSFNPETWDCTETEYLYAQREFVGAFSRRLAKFNNVIWDLVNEPLGKQGSGADDFDFTAWAREMARTIRQNGNKHQMITAGYAEGLSEGRPSPWITGDTIDFTTIHTDSHAKDLLYDTISGRVPGKPCLIGETRVSNYQNTADKSHFERKMITAFAAGAAGVIEWMYTPEFLKSTAEGIFPGLLRQDKSQKPEFRLISEIRSFMRKAKTHLREREMEEICIVMPEASTSLPGISERGVRSALHEMEYQCRIPARIIGERFLDKIGSPRLIILPSPLVIAQDTWNRLISLAEEGATLLATGALESDEQDNPIDRLSQYGIEVRSEPVSAVEKLIIFGSEHEVIFGESEAGRINKGIISGTTGQIKSQAAGEGNLIYAGLPFELAENKEPLVSLYRYALKQAGIQPRFNAESIHSEVLVRPLIFNDAVLYCVISLANEDAPINLMDGITGRGLDFMLPAGKSIMILLDHADGSIIAEYGGCVTADDAVQRAA